MLSYALQIAATCLCTFKTVTCAQAVLHRWVGHGRFVRSIHERHILSHHSLFKGRHFDAPTYTVKEKSVSHTYLPVAAAIGTFSYWLLPIDLAVVSLLSLLVTFVAHIYLHEHYHLSGSWLLRFLWFRHLKELHKVHHAAPRKNFGIIDYSWDRLLGTFSHAKRDQGVQESHQ